MMDIDNEGASEVRLLHEKASKLTAARRLAVESRKLQMEELKKMLHEQRMEIENKGLRLKMSERDLKRIKSLEFNTSLPIWEWKDKIVNTIEQSRVTIISGGCGCGKSTQVPQYILNTMIEQQKECKIVCTQPRRLAATSLCVRVAHERKCKAGDEVGFRIGGHAMCKTLKTRILYMTTGVLREILLHDSKLEKITHVILDEVHERTADIDITAACLRELMRESRVKLKLIVMSATMNMQRFCNYFSSALGSDSVGCVDIPDAASPFPVKTFYLDDVARSILRLDRADTRGLIVDEMWGKTHCRLGHFRKAAFFMFFEIIHSKKAISDTFLLFLPSGGLISEFCDVISKKYKDVICFTLHSSIPIEDQHTVMIPVSGRRKVILATNIAESSITVPNVSVIVDFCLQKVMEWDPETQCHTLIEAGASQYSCEQRSGRTGRVCPGEVYRWISKREYDQLSESSLPEIRQMNLDRILLKVLRLNWSSPIDIISSTIDPPKIENVAESFNFLRDIGAIVQVGIAMMRPEDRHKPISVDFLKSYNQKFEMTYAGKVLSALSCDTLHGLLIWYGHLFSCLDEAVILAAIASKKTPIQLPISTPEVSAMSSYNYALGSGSDLIAGVHAFKLWQLARVRGAFTEDTEKEWCEKHRLSLFYLREIEDTIVSFREELFQFAMCPKVSKSKKKEIAIRRKAGIQHSVTGVQQAIKHNAQMDALEEEDATNEKKSELVDSLDLLMKRMKIEQFNMQSNDGEVDADLMDEIEEFIAEEAEEPEEDPFESPFDDFGTGDCSSPQTEDQAWSALLSAYKEDGEKLYNQKYSQLLQEVAIEPTKSAMLSLLIAAAFRNHMYLVRSKQDEPHLVYNKMERASEWPSGGTGQSILLTKLSVGDHGPNSRGGQLSLEERNAIGDKIKRHCLFVGGLKEYQLQSRLPRAALVLFANPSLSKGILTARDDAVSDSDFCTRGGLGIRLLARSVCSRRGLKRNYEAIKEEHEAPQQEAISVSWHDAHLRLDHDGIAIPLFTDETSQGLVDVCSVAYPLYIADPTDTRYEIVTLVPSRTIRTVKHRATDKYRLENVTVLRAWGVRELAFLLFARLQKVVQLQGPKIKENMYMVEAICRENTVRFNVLLTPQMVYRIAVMRRFLRRKFCRSENRTVLTVSLGGEMENEVQEEEEAIADLEEEKICLSALKALEPDLLVDVAKGLQNFNWTFADPEPSKDMSSTVAESQLLWMFNNCQCAQPSERQLQRKWYSVKGNWDKERDVLLFHQIEVQE